ncbi:MAG: hypothetical protein LBC86_01880 [Oscillospiraceae bacterium]|jgi:hypothetical protein|nr:hypothetical protein [Oscillospiraceae bacterium]
MSKKNYNEIRPTIAICYVSDEELKEPLEFERRDDGTLMLFPSRESAEEYLLSQWGESKFDYMFGIIPVPAYIDLDNLLE